MPGGELMQTIDKVMTASEIVEKYKVGPSNLIKAFKMGWKDFEQGVNCRKSGKYWITDKEIVDQAYNRKVVKNENY